MWLPLVLAVQLSLPGCADNVCLKKRSDGWLWLTSRASETRTAVVNLPPRCATRREAPPLIPVSPGDEVRIANLNRNCSEATLHHNRGVPIDQVQDVVYQTPIARGYRYEITQGSGRRTSHARWEANATDFAARIGTPIVAARGGTVIELRQDSTTNCRRKTRACFDLANILVIEHEDGSVAYYVHLAPGSVRVGIGDRVRTGEIIASVGSTGFTTGPHLHFDVVALGPRLERVSLPVEFDAAR